MATSSRPWRATESRSGGKMVRARRTARPRTPYERHPRLLRTSGPQNPNWLSRLIFSPTRMIATGASKVIAGVFGPESSSSSSSSSDGDFASENDMDDVNNDNDFHYQGAEGLEKNHVPEKIDSLTEGPQPVEWKSERKRVIEQLLIQETFSREECDRLMHIIKSRLVDSPITGGIDDGRPGEIPDRIVDVDKPDIRSTAVTEAKKWLEGRKLGSNSKSELDYGTCTLNTAMLPHVTEGEVGSPVDLAKSYMQARPPWASPSSNHIQSKSPSPIGIQLFKEDTPYSFGHNSVSTSKLNMDSPASGSWNIQEEIRKVRSKATEEMLKNRPSSKLERSALASDYRSPYLFVADKVDVSQIAQDGMQNENFPPIPATFIPEKNEDLGASPIIEGREGILNNGQALQLPEGARKDIPVLQSDAAVAPDGGLIDTDGTSQPLRSTELASIQDAIPDSRLPEINSQSLKEVTGAGGAVAINGFPSSGSSLSAGDEREEMAAQSDEVNNAVGSSHGQITSAAPIKETCELNNAVGSSHDQITISAPIKETCELLSEALMEIPDSNENDGLADRSQNSSSMHNKGISQDPITPKSKRKLAGRTGGVTGKQQTRRLSSRHNRRTRGRDK